MAGASIDGLFWFLNSEVAYEKEHEMQTLKRQTIGTLKELDVSPQNLVLFCVLNRFMKMTGAKTDGFIKEPRVVADVVKEVKTKLNYNQVVQIPELITFGTSERSEEIDSSKYPVKLQELVNFDEFEDNWNLNKIVENLGISFSNFIYILRITTISTCATVTQRKVIPPSKLSVLLLIPLIKYFQKYPANKFVEHIGSDGKTAIVTTRRADFFVSRTGVDGANVHHHQMYTPQNPYTTKFLGSALTTLVMLQRPWKAFHISEILKDSKSCFPSIIRVHENWKKLLKLGTSQSKNYRKINLNNYKFHHLEMKRLSFYRWQILTLAADISSEKDVEFKIEVERMISICFRKLKNLELGMFIIKNGLWENTAPFHVLQPSAKGAPTFALVYEGPAPVGYENDPKFVTSEKLEFQCILNSTIPNHKSDDNNGEQPYRIVAEVPNGFCNFS